MAKTTVATDLREAFHLPRPTWQQVVALQEETHPDIPLDDFSIDIVTSEMPISFLRPDPRCPKGQQRRVNAVLEFYFTVTIKGSLKKNPEKLCTYKTGFSGSASGTKARIKAGSYKEGECEKE